MVTKGELAGKREVEALLQQRVSISAFVEKNPRTWQENMTGERWWETWARERWRKKYDGRAVAGKRLARRRERKVGTHKP
jgi:hypothetical protein